MQKNWIRWRVEGGINNTWFSIVLTVIVVLLLLLAGLGPVLMLWLR